MPAIIEVQHGQTGPQDLVFRVAVVEGLDVPCSAPILAAYLALNEPLTQCMSLHAQNQVAEEIARQTKVLEIKNPKLVVVGKL
jgi:hypothetical protein